MYMYMVKLRILQLFQTIALLIIQRIWRYMYILKISMFGFTAAFPDQIRTSQMTTGHMVASKYIRVIARVQRFIFLHGLRATPRTNLRVWNAANRPYKVNHWTSAITLLPCYLLLHFKHSSGDIKSQVRKNHHDMAFLHLFSLSCL